MNTPEHITPFVPDPSWKDGAGALIAIAHPDDEVLIGWGLIQVLTNAGIPVTVLLASLGENGKADGQPMEPGMLGRLRTEEFLDSASALGVRARILDPAFPDSSMTGHEEELTRAISREIRREDYGVVFTFAPEERTWMFDHRDHHIVGAATMAAAETADMPLESLASTPPRTSRPNLYGWTTNPHASAEHQIESIPIDEQSVREREHFLSTHYPSQFPKETMSQWSTIFQEITKGPLDKQRQLYIQIR